MLAVGRSALLCSNRTGDAAVFADLPGHDGTCPRLAADGLLPRQVADVTSAQVTFPCACRGAGRPQ